MIKQKNKQTHKNILGRINIGFTLVLIILNFILLLFFNNNKILFVTISIVINVYLFFLHCYILTKLAKKNLSAMKKEASFVNYGSTTITFILCLLVVLFLCSGLLFFVGPESLNLTLVSLFYVSILTMILPSIVLLAYLYFVVPAMVIPSLTIKSYYKANSMSILGAIFILFTIFCLCRGAIHFLYENNFLTQIKFKVEKITVEFSTRFLKVDERLTPTEKRILERKDVDIPFLYTSQAFFYKDYKDAKLFCDSMDARLPNHLEVFNIAFNRFNTFGENYYWTSTNEARQPFLVHFKNMSYSVEPFNKDVVPLAYCVSNMSEQEKNSNKHLRKYFIRDIKKHIKATTYKIEYDTPDQSSEELDLLAKLNSGITTTEYSDIETDKKHVNFSVKEVNREVMKSLLQKGYAYNPNLTLNAKNKIAPDQIGYKIVKDPNKKQIRLCYYPFIEYSNMTMNEEAQIWKQSFCSPSFELIQQYPQTTSAYEKDNHCASMGGRLPNIPELVGILKSLSIEKTGIKYWTNNNVTQDSTGVSYPISVYFKDSMFLVPNLAEKSEMAYTYCIRPAQKQSRLITNYSSRFKGLDGRQYAKAKCSNCQYSEVPDTIFNNK